jgi:hypothetical protein
MEDPQKLTTELSFPVIPLQYISKGNNQYVEKISALLWSSQYYSQ